MIDTLLIIILVMVIILFIGLSYLIIVDKKSSVKRENNYTKYNEIENKQNEIKTELDTNFRNLTNTLSANYKTINDSLFESSDKLKDSINHKLNIITTQATKIEGTKTYIEKLNKRIGDFQQILSNKNARGLFGEAQLYQILTLVYGDNSNFFEKQYSYLANGHSVTVDAIVFTGTNKNIPIDSKFSLENFEKLKDSTLNDYEKERAEKDMIKDLKNRINETSKYVDPVMTTPFALMFIPAESIYVMIYEKYINKIVKYATEKKVIIVSPSSIWAILSNVIETQKIIKHNKNAQKINEQIEVLKLDFTRMLDRWGKLLDKITTLDKVSSELNISMKKLTKKFGKIKDGELE